jgi:hypothetical protein
VTTVANVLLKTPIKNDLPGVNRPSDPAATCAAINIPLTRSNTPYVIAGLAVNTNPGFSPVHKPVTPSSAMISRAVSNSPGDLIPWSGVRSCCRVAITATGIVKICANAPARAPRMSSSEVESWMTGFAALRESRLRVQSRRQLWKKKYANSESGKSEISDGALLSVRMIDIRMLNVFIMLALNPLKNPVKPSLCQMRRSRDRTPCFCCLVKPASSSWAA